jgi:hypothetical protein
VLGVELDETVLHLAQHLAHGDAEDSLAATDEVDDLIVGGAEVDARPVAHERGLGEVTYARLAELVDRGADLLQRDSGVEQSLDKLEHEDVAEAIETLRTGPGGATHRRLDELGAGPVVQLAIADSGRASGDGTAIASRVIEVGKTVGEEQTEIVTRILVTGTELTHLTAFHTVVDHPQLSRSG